ncbi:MAG: hypothetical protein ACYCXF_06875 [Thermoleophilia bacterium]
MKRFRFNLLWYLGVVVLADIVPLVLFLLLHLVGSLATVAPQLIATVLFFFVLCVQAFMHLNQMNRRFPESGDRNVWSTLGLTLLAVVTMPVIILALIVWASSRTV